MIVMINNDRTAMVHKLLAQNNELEGETICLICEKETPIGENGDIQAFRVIPEGIQHMFQVFKPESDDDAHVKIAIDGDWPTEILIATVCKFNRSVGFNNISFLMIGKEEVHCFN